MTPAEHLAAALGALVDQDEALEWTIRKVRADRPSLEDLIREPESLTEWSQDASGGTGWKP